MKTEYSLECEKCGSYNLQNGIIEKGRIYCIDCHDKIEDQRRKWRYYKNFIVKKVPINFKKKDGTKLTIFARKVTRRKPVKRWRI